MADLWQLGALELAELIRKGEASSRQAVESCLGRIDAVNPELNAVVVVLADEALAAADAADDDVRSGRDGLGPLHGVPFTVKENIDVAGSSTTHGIPAFEQAVAALDAPVVERMRAAGAIPFARTNLPDFGLRVHTDSSLRGVTRNPWNRELTAGGSSGGEASALASGMTPLGLGNDLGGSLRNPAHCCGIAAIKPSTGVVPHASCIPPEDHTIMFQLMAVEGVMARQVADLRAGLLAVAGPHRRDPLALPVVMAEPSPGARLRVAVVPEPPGGATDPGIAAAIRAAADKLAEQGHTVEELVPPGYARTVELWGELLLADLRALRPLLDGLIGVDGRAFLDHAERHIPVIDTATMTMLHLERHRTAREWCQFFADWDVLLSPTWAQPPFAHGADVETFEGALAVRDTMRPVLPANLLGLPAAVVPCGLAGGMPVGAQLVADRFDDLTALAAAQAVEDAMGVITPIDPG
jgi:amidase